MALAAAIPILRRSIHSYSRQGISDNSSVVIAIRIKLMIAHHLIPRWWLLAIALVEKRTKSPICSRCPWPSRPNQSHTQTTSTTSARDDIAAYRETGVRAMLSCEMLTLSVFVPMPPQAQQRRLLPQSPPVQEPSLGQRKGRSAIEKRWVRCESSTLQIQNPAMAMGISTAPPHACACSLGFADYAPHYDADRDVLIRTSRDALSQRMCKFPRLTA